MMRRSTSLQVVKRPHSGHELYGDISTGVFRPLIPPKFRPLAIATLRNVAKYTAMSPYSRITSPIRPPACRLTVIGPLPSSAGYTYIFTIVDMTTRWPEAIPLSTTTAADCAQALLMGWIQRFGIPSTITSERDQFTSSLWAALCNILSIKHSPTTAYHPQANGRVKKFHRRLKDSLRS
jgi:hypothetical protein